MICLTRPAILCCSTFADLFIVVCYVYSFESEKLNRLAEALDRVHETCEYWLPRRDDIFEILRRQ